MIDLFPNETFPIMVGIYLVVLFVLNSLVFKPTLRLIEERGKQFGKTHGEVGGAAPAHAEALNAAGSAVGEGAIGSDP